MAFVRTATVIFDTDVLVWGLRGMKKAIDLIEESPTRAASIVSRMEILQGALNKTEHAQIRLTLASLEILPLTENIGHRANIYIEQFALRNRLDVMDALIAATALENAMPLCTANVKHFRLIPDLELHIFRP